MKMNNSKAEPVSSWCHGEPRVPMMKAEVHGVYLVKVAVQEDHAREVHPDRQDGLLGDEERG